MTVFFLKRFLPNCHKIPLHILVVYMVTCNCANLVVFVGKYKPSKKLAFLLSWQRSEGELYLYGKSKNMIEIC